MHGDGKNDQRENPTTTKYQKRPQKAKSPRVITLVITPFNQIYIFFLLNIQIYIYIYIF